MREKFVDRLYYGKYTHMVQIKPYACRHSELRYLMRCIVHGASMNYQPVIQILRDKIQNSPNKELQVNWRGEIYNFTSDRYVRATITEKSLDEVEKFFDFYTANRGQFTVGTIRREQENLSFYCNDSVLQDMLVQQLPKLVTAIGRPRSEEHRAQLATNAEESSVLRKVVCKKRLKDGCYRFSMFLKSEYDLAANHPAVLSMIGDLATQGACLLNPALARIVLDGAWLVKTTNKWDATWRGSSRLWFKDDSDLGLLLLALGSNYIQHIEEYRVVS